MSEFEDDVDPLFLKAQLQRIKDEQKKHRNAVNPATYNRPKEESPRPLGCGLFMVVALAWCLVAGCGMSPAVKTQTEKTIDMSRRMHHRSCIEVAVDIETGLPIISEWPHIMEQAECEEWEAQLIAAEPTLEDAFAKAKAQALRVFWRDKLSPVVIPWLEDSLITIVQLGLGYISLDLLSGALQEFQEPP